jgi:PTH1 family peptidyl-tRNA hydrolase
MFRFRKESNDPIRSGSFTSMGQPSFIIAGLGNPGSKYEDTRHNVGFQVIDLLAKEYNVKVKDRKFGAFLGSAVIGMEKVLLLKPQTFMNRSGESIAAALKFYQLEASSGLIVIYDDVALAPGRIRIRTKGSAGGHNGIKNIILHAKTQEFLRIKIGVGEKPLEWDLADYVLSRIPKNERTAVREAQEHAMDALPLLLRGEIERAMNEYNRA